MPKNEPVRIPDWPGNCPEVTEAVARILNDGTWGRYHGECTNRLQEALRERFQMNLVTLCSSGTIGVEFALRAAGIGSGDEVILAGYDFPGNFRSIEVCGATPVLVDVQKNGWVIDEHHIALGLSPKTRAVLLSHLHGQLADCIQIRKLCDERNLVLIEDACQVPGATLFGQVCGSFGHVSVLSFGGSKLLSAGRGGAVLTNNESMHQRLKIWKDRGNDIAPLSELQAAALLPQLAKLNHLNEIRLTAATKLSLALREVAEHFVNLVNLDKGASRTAIYKYPMLMTDSLAAKKSRAQLCSSFEQAGIPISEGFHSFSKRTPRRARVAEPLVNSILAGERTLLLHHPALLCPDADLLKIAEGIVDSILA